MTRERLVYIAPIGVIAVSVVVCLYYFTQAYKLTERYEDPEQGIAFKYPADWAVEKDEEHNSICIGNSRAAMQRIQGNGDPLRNDVEMCLSIEGPEYLTLRGIPKFESALAMAQAIKDEVKYDQLVTKIVGPKQLKDFPYDAAQITVGGEAGEAEVKYKEYITIIIRFDDQHTAWFGVDIRSNSTWWTQRKYKATFLAIARSIQFTNPNSAP